MFWNKKEERETTECYVCKHIIYKETALEIPIRLVGLLLELSEDRYRVKNRYYCKNDIPKFDFITEDKFSYKMNFRYYKKVEVTEEGKVV